MSFQLPPQVSLQEKQGEVEDAGSQSMLKDLAVYLTLEKAEVGRMQEALGLEMCACGWRRSRRGRRRGWAQQSGFLYCLGLDTLPTQCQHQCDGPSTRTAAQFHSLQRLYGFDPAKYGITDAQAAKIATVFTGERPLGMSAHIQRTFRARDLLCTLCPHLGTSPCARWAPSRRARL